MPLRRAAPLVLAVALAGCTTFAGATRDATHLVGQVPSGLGRRLLVEVEVAPIESRLAAGAEDEEAAARGLDGRHLDPHTRDDLVRALAAELEEQDLFDRVEPAAPGAGSAARLRVFLLAAESREVYDGRQIAWAWVARHELDVRLEDARGRVVLEGRVSGVAMDEVTGDLDAGARDELRLASLRDAATKLSRALRRTAEDRARAAEAGVVKVRVAPGIGPVGVAVLGFDDEEQARRLRGPPLCLHLEHALVLLGNDVAPTRPEDVQRALDRSPVGTGLFALGPGVEAIAVQLPSRLYVVGRVTSASGRVSAEARVLDRRGRLAFPALTASAEGLGALRLVAVDLARQIGQGIEGLPPPKPDGS